MKFRTDFVTNSSSSSFIISKKYAETMEQLNILIKKVIMLRNKLMSHIRVNSNWFKTQKPWSEIISSYKASFPGSYKNAVDCLMQSEFAFSKSVSTDIVDNIIETMSIGLFGELDSDIDECGCYEIVDMAQPIDMTSYFGSCEIATWYLGGLCDLFFPDDGTFNENAYKKGYINNSSEFDELYNKLIAMENKPTINDLFIEKYNRYVLYGDSEFSFDYAFGLIFGQLCAAHCTHMG